MWGPLRRAVEERFPDRPDMWLPEKPMRSYHWRYGQARAAEVLDELGDVLERTAAAKATEMGACSGSGSWTHPARDDLIEIDGKVLDAACRGSSAENDQRVADGLPPLKRFDRDAYSQRQGGGDVVVGNKFVVASTRTADSHSRLILSVVADPDHREVDHAMEIVDRLVNRLPEMRGIVYDAALRGKHIQHLMHDHGLLAIAPVVAQSGGRRDPERVERRVPVEKSATVKNGRLTTVELFAEGGAACVLLPPSVDGQRRAVPLKVQQVKRCANADGTHRFYETWILPPEMGGGTVTQSLTMTDQDRARKFNRTEHLRAFPPTSEQYKKLYGRRSDAESANRQIDDGLYLRRANSFGRDRNLLDLYCHAAAVNAIAIAKHRARSHPPARAA